MGILGWDTHLEQPKSVLMQIFVSSHISERHSPLDCHILPYGSRLL